MNDDRKCEDCKYADWDHPDRAKVSMNRSNRLRWGICMYPLVQLPACMGRPYLCRNITDEPLKHPCPTFEEKHQGNP